MMTIDDALREIQQHCSEDCYVTILDILDYAEDLEQEVEFLNVEIEAISSCPKKRRRKQEDDWE